MDHRQTEDPYVSLDIHEGLGAAWYANMEAVGRPVDTMPGFVGGSSDVGDVSQVVPSVHVMVVVRNSTAVPHHPGLTADAVLDGGTVVAPTVLDAALDPGCAPTKRASMSSLQVILLWLLVLVLFQQFVPVVEEKLVPVVKSNPW
ncbi:hypothetical protein PV761_06365 [Arthrobacter sp. CC3]|uniref:hypothetical protein n=1 Tax=Arthrobacter sp. CC3 TaxID=3029185 RepID=UPI003266C0BC